MDALWHMAKHWHEKTKIRLVSLYLLIRSVFALAVSGLISGLYLYVVQETVHLSAWPILLFPIGWTIIWGYFGGIAFLFYREDVKD